MSRDDGFNRIARFPNVPHHGKAGLARQELMVQIQNSVGSIDPLGKPRHYISKRLRVIVAEHVAECFNQQLRVDSARGLARLNRPHVICEKVWKSAILNPKGLACLTAVKKVDRAGNCRACAWQNVAVRIERRRKKIAVAAPIVTEKRADVRQCAGYVAAAQEQLRGAEGTGGHDHYTRSFAIRHALPCIKAVKVYAIAAIHGLDIGNQRKLAHLSIPLLSGGNVVAVQGIPCVNFAAYVAVAQMYAGPLFHTLRIDERFALRWVMGVILLVRI